MTVYYSVIFPSVITLRFSSVASAPLTLKVGPIDRIRAITSIGHDFIQPGDHFGQSGNPPPPWSDATRQISKKIVNGDLLRCDLFVGCEISIRTKNVLLP